MCQLIESIRVENGHLCNLNFHNNRLNNSRKVLFGNIEDIILDEILEIPAQYSNGIYKCRVTYDQEIKKIEFAPYIMRQINSLRLIIADHINYSHKYSNRTELDKLSELRNECDDILIVKNGFITDTSYANIVFSRGNEFYTPDTPLLNGTRREFYLQKGIIKTASITPVDLSKFSNARIINAMISLEDSPVIDIKNIKW
jgi:4-amino-4-deoxychorismate lyase